MSYIEPLRGFFYRSNSSTYIQQLLSVKIMNTFKPTDEAVILAYEGYYHLRSLGYQLDPSTIEGATISFEHLVAHDCIEHTLVKRCFGTNFLPPAGSPERDGYKAEAIAFIATYFLEGGGVKARTLHQEYPEQEIFLHWLEWEVDVDFFYEVYDLWNAIREGTYSMKFSL